MPPKLALAINVEPEPESIRISDDSLTVLTQSHNPVSFTAEGMRLKNEGVFYKARISEKDIRIIKKLGQGASSIVYKGFLVRENKFVAVKKINVFERETRHQMINDLKALCDAPSNVPGLVSFYGAYHVPESGQISIVLEYVDGGSLADVLAKVGRIPENVLSKMTSKILRALAYLHKEKHLRPTAEMLLGHPFITKTSASDPSVSLKDFMQCVFNPHDKLDEIAIVFAHNYYALLNAGVVRLRDLAPLYSAESTLRYDGDSTVGCDAILAKLQSVAHMHAGWKVTHEVVDVQCQPLGFYGSALVNVAGRLESPAAANKPQPFTEVFVLSQMQVGQEGEKGGRGGRGLGGAWNSRVNP
uniref:mitogen-activated protein kinase kinase n=1 Tax=Volvox carteri f. nagariensis TaxID=3068 RepID=D9CIX4_VOLCA|nr:MAPKK1f [Volvox carteri f. nagariensis]